MQEYEDLKKKLDSVKQEIESLMQKLQIEFCILENIKEKLLNML